MDFGIDPSFGLASVAPPVPSSSQAAQVAFVQPVYTAPASATPVVTAAPSAPAHPQFDPGLDLGFGSIVVAPIQRGPGLTTVLVTAGLGLAVLAFARAGRS